MAQIKITLDTGNDAFSPDPAIEVRRIMQNWVNGIFEGDSLDTLESVLMDANGNSCGRITVRGM